jgi:hypothetical protein
MNTSVTTRTLNGCGWEVQVFDGRWRNSVRDIAGDLFVFTEKRFAEDHLEDLITSNTPGSYRVYESLSDHQL